MKATAYQAPKLSVLAFEREDVITASGETPSSDKLFDKGVEDFF